MRHSIGRIAGIAALCLVPGAACNSGSDGDDPTSRSSSATSVAETSTFHVDEAGGFSFSYPRSWTEQEPASGLIAVALLSPESTIEDGFRTNINIVIEPLNADMDSQAYADANITLVSGTFQDFEELDRGTTTIGGDPAIWLEYTATEGSFDDQLAAMSLVEGSFRFDA